MHTSSRLEHSLVLAMAFTSFDPTRGGLRKFTESLWNDKFATAFDLAKDTSRSQVRPRHIEGRVKKGSSESNFTWRLRQRRGPLSIFTFLGLRRFLAILLDYEVSIESFVTDITRDEFQTVCGDLDECDRLLKKGDPSWFRASLRGVPGCPFRSLLLRVNNTKEPLSDPSYSISSSRPPKQRPICT